MDLLLVPLDDAIVFPSVTATLQIDVGDEEQVFLLPRREGEFARVGVIADVVERGNSPRGETVATVVGLRRGLAGIAHPDELDPDALPDPVEVTWQDGEHTLHLLGPCSPRAVADDLGARRFDATRSLVARKSFAAPRRTRR